MDNGKLEVIRSARKVQVLSRFATLSRSYPNPRFGGSPTNPSEQCKASRTACLRSILNPSTLIPSFIAHEGESRDRFPLRGAQVSKWRAAPITSSPAPQRRARGDPWNWPDIRQTTIRAIPPMDISADGLFVSGVTTPKHSTCSTGRIRRRNRRYHANGMSRYLTLSRYSA